MGITVGGGKERARLEGNVGADVASNYECFEVLIFLGDLHSLTDHDNKFSGRMSSKYAVMEIYFFCSVLLVGAPLPGQGSSPLLSTRSSTVHASHYLPLFQSLPSLSLICQSSSITPTPFMRSLRRFSLHRLSSQWVPLSCFTNL